MLKLKNVLMVALACAWVVGCEEVPVDQQYGLYEQAGIIPGPWVIPPETLAIGDTQYMEYVGAGPWNDGAACAPWLLPGTVEFRDYLYAHFPQIAHIGGYNCRPIGGTNTLSLHGTGRALDIHIDMISGDADNDLGDPIGNWLIENAEYIGIQYIIWDQWSWGAHRPAGDKDRSYGGVSPHKDHLHIELSVDAANQRTDFFLNPQLPPDLSPCDTIPAGGGTVDNDGPCFNAYGSAQYWRRVDGEGIDGSLVWTNAFANDKPSNWARWYLYFEAEGDYEVEVYVGAKTYAVYDKTRYGLRYDGDQEQDIIVDQSAPGDWRSLGVFHFQADGVPQFIDVFDNYTGTIPADQHIMADAVRLTPYTPGGEDTNPPAEDTNPPAEDTSPPGEDVGGDATLVDGGPTTTRPPGEDVGGEVEGGDPNAQVQTAEACACRVRTTGHRSGGLAWTWLLLAGAAMVGYRRRGAR